MAVIGDATSATRKNQIGSVGRLGPLSDQGEAMTAQHRFGRITLIRRHFHQYVT